MQGTGCINRIYTCLLECLLLFKAAVFEGSLKSSLKFFVND